MPQPSPRRCRARSPSTLSGLQRLLLSCALASAPQLATGNAAAQPAQAQCSAANRQALADLQRTLDATRQRNLLNPVLVARLQTFGAQLGRLRDATLRPAKSIADCEHSAALIGAERERLERIVDPQAVRVAALASSAANAAAAPAAAPQPVGDTRAAEACRAETIDAYGDVQRSWRERAAARGLKAGDGEFDATQARLRGLRDALARPGSLRDCEALTAALAQEQGRWAPGATALRATAPAASAARALAASPGPANSTAPAQSAAPMAAAAAPPPAAQQSAAAAEACRRRQGLAYNEVAQVYTRQIGAAPLARETTVALSALGERLTALHAAITNPALPGWDCAQAAQRLALLRAELERLQPSAAASAPPPAAVTRGASAAAQAAQ